ncbi:MAG TPA: hypothetical protein VFE61_17240 [Candidatus Sulfotelmatobacter sp.]|nr:hypothetical protein [Candidatus Sulfotelmatobacter sp.]
MAGLKIFALWAACFSSLSCGGYYFVGFVSNPGGTTSITGMVIAVSSGFMADPSGVTQNTAVTFMNGGSETTIKFCGDQQHLFPIDATVRADYTAGVMCSVLVRVVVDNERTESRDTASLQYGDTSTPAYLRALH